MRLSTRRGGGYVNRVNEQQFFGKRQQGCEKQQKSDVIKGDFSEVSVNVHIEDRVIERVKLRKSTSLIKLYALYFFYNIINQFLLSIARYRASLI